MEIKDKKQLLLDFVYDDMFDAEYTIFLANGQSFNSESIESISSDENNTFWKLKVENGFDVISISQITHIKINNL